MGFLILGMVNPNELGTMPIQVDQTSFFCKFCERQGHHMPLVRSMHGLYCTNENCYSRITDGNLAPATKCEKCGENSFYVEETGTLETAIYLCIVCGHKNAIE